MKETVQFRFPNAATPAEVENDLALAIFTAQCVHGRPQTRLQVAYNVSENGQRATLETNGAAGEVALRVFLGLCGARFGEDGFRVRLETVADQGVSA